MYNSILRSIGVSWLAVASASACGGKIESIEDDAGSIGLPAEGCGPLDPSLKCGADACGNAVMPICRPSLWVCPPIPSACALDASPGDAGMRPPGFPCGDGTCAPNTFCEDAVGTSPAACIPFPQECRRTPYSPAATCACLERRAAQDRLCRPMRYLCPYPTSNLVAVHVGCVPD